MSEQEPTKKPTVMSMEAHPKRPPPPPMSYHQRLRRAPESYVPKSSNSCKPKEENKPAGEQETSH